MLNLREIMYLESVRVRDGVGEPAVGVLSHPPRDDQRRARDISGLVTQQKSDRFHDLLDLSQSFKGHSINFLGRDHGCVPVEVRRTA